MGFAWYFTWRPWVKSTDASYMPWRHSFLLPDSSTTFHPGQASAWKQLLSTYWMTASTLAVWSIRKKKCSSVCQIADRGPSAWMANYRWKRAGKQKQSLKGTLFRKELVSREAEEVKEGVVYAAGTDEFFCCGSWVNETDSSLSFQIGKDWTVQETEPSATRYMKQSKFFSRVVKLIMWKRGRDTGVLTFDWIVRSLTQ